MASIHSREPWHNGKLVGQKPPLKPTAIWAIRIDLQHRDQVLELVMLIFGIDRKLWRSELGNLLGRDATYGNQIL